jgi:hypothetical protein
MFRHGLQRAFEEPAIGSRKLQSYTDDDRMPVGVTDERKFDLLIARR